MRHVSDLPGAALMTMVLALTAGTGSADPNESGRPVPRLNTLGEIFSAIRACWLPPPVDQAHEGMEISVRVSFTREGAILGEPRFTFLTRGVSQATRTVYERAVVAALNRCTPLLFTPQLGGAVAGQPFSIRFVDKRATPGSRI